MAEAAERPVVVAGSVGPTGSLFEPLGELTEADALETFARGDRGAGRRRRRRRVDRDDVGAARRCAAAANAAIAVGVPYVATCSFDTAGRTMMGMLPGDLTEVFDGLDVPPVATGANCGVGASDILVSLLAMTEHDAETAFVSKGNCGIPEFRGAEIHYSGTPELMARVRGRSRSTPARASSAAAAAPRPSTSRRCGRALDAALEDRALDGPGPRPTMESIVEAIGPLANAAPRSDAAPRAPADARRG